MSDMGLNILRLVYVLLTCGPMARCVYLGLNGAQMIAGTPPAPVTTVTAIDRTTTITTTIATSTTTPNSTDTHMLAQPALSYTTPNARGMNQGTTASVTHSTSVTGQYTGTVYQNTTNSTTNEMRQMKILLNALFDQYDSRIRPLEDQSQCLTIKSSLVPLTVIDLNTQTQTLSIQAYFQFHWMDDLLKWDQTTPGVGKSIRIQIKPMWIPHIKISKELFSEGAVGSRDTDIALVNYRDVAWWPEGIYSTVCLVDITFFPYDTQGCTFTYYVDDEDASTVRLELLRLDVKMDEYIENAEWKMINSSHELRLVDEIYYIEYHFTLERRAEFATFTLIVPAVAISLLCVCGFLVPIDSGEKGSVSMTVFLACSVYMTVLIDLLPHNSLTHSRFVLYVIILLFVSVFLILYTIVQSRVIHCWDKQKKVQVSFCKCLARTRFTLAELLKWIDNALFVISSICLISSYSVLLFTMKG